MYFLRRFLDKDYVRNAIVYTGAAHSVSYIYILISIGFKITHVSKSKIKNMKKLNGAISKIKEFPSEQSIYELLVLFLPSKVKQCTDISNFPEDFEWNEFGVQNVIVKI